VEAELDGTSRFVRVPLAGRGTALRSGLAPTLDSDGDGLVSRSLRTTEDSTGAAGVMLVVVAAVAAMAVDASGELGSGVDAAAIRGEV
jgi:hypothetical protein